MSAGMSAAELAAWNALTSNEQAAEIARIEAKYQYSTADDVCQAGDPLEDDEYEEGEE